MEENQIPPEREPLDCNLHIMIPASLEREIDAYVEAHKVRKAVAVRHILRTFLSGDFRKTKVDREEIGTSVTGF